MVLIQFCYDKSYLKNVLNQKNGEYFFEVLGDVLVIFKKYKINVTPLIHFVLFYNYFYNKHRQYRFYVRIFNYRHQSEPCFGILERKRRSYYGELL